MPLPTPPEEQNKDETLSKSDAVGHPEDVFFKTRLCEFSNDNVNVFMVDGSTIRNPLNEPYEQDFTEGDNDAHCAERGSKLCAPGEVYIDLDVAPTEVRCTILHELRERREMIDNGLPYANAHDVANAAEKHARSNRDQLGELVKAELKLSPKFKEKKGMRKMIRKAVSLATKLSDKGEEEIVITTPNYDRGNDRVFPTGAILDNYNRNPIVMWLHDYHGTTASGGIPIAKCPYLKVTENGIIAGPPQFLEGDPFAERVKNAWKQGYIKTASIGFNPVEYEENERGGYDYKTWEMLEWSLVPIPMNAEACKVAKSAGFIDLIEHKTSQQEIKDELDYVLNIVSEWDLNADNQKIARKLYTELIKRFAVDDTTVKDTEEEAYEALIKILEKKTGV